MKNTLILVVVLFIFPLLSYSQVENQVIKGRSETKRLKYDNTSAIKIKRINPSVIIDSLSFVDINGNNLLDCGEEAEFICVILNKTDDTLKNLSLNIESFEKDINAVFPNKNNIERIDPRASLELSVPVKLVCSKNIGDSILNLSFSLIQNDLLLSEKDINIELGKIAKPNLGIEYNYSVKKDTIINEREQEVDFIELNVFIKNAGECPLFDCTATFKLQYIGGTILSDQDIFKFDYINPEGEEEINISLIIESTYGQETYPILFELRGEDNFKYNEKIDIEL